MNVGVLFSGGKDSAYAAFLAKKHGHSIACLISVMSENLESYMFHTPSISKVEQQAEVMNIPILVKKTKGKKEEELIDLENLINQAKNDYKINGIVTGTVESAYQASRIQKICDNLDIDCFNPLWQKNPDEYWEELIDNGFEIIITSVSAEGVKKDWLGKIIDWKLINELKTIKKKYGIHLIFEGGEAETFVTDCPLFNKRLKIISFDKLLSRDSGRYEIGNIELIDK